MEIEDEKVKEIVDNLEVIIQEIDKLKEVIPMIKYKEDIKHLFNTLYDKILDGYQVDSIIYVDNNNNLKYLTEYPALSGRPNLLIVKNKGYLWNTSYLSKNELFIKYFAKYDIPDDILNLMQKIPESNIDSADNSIFKLYHLIKKGYKINIIEVKDN